MLDLVREFAFPRFPGTDAERLAADRLAAHFGAAGLEVTREPFHACTRAVPRFRRVAHGLAAAGVAAQALLLAEGPPALALVAGLLLLAGFARSGGWPSRLERGFDREPRIESGNVVGSRPRTATDRHRRLVVLAHVDSKSARWPTFVPASLLLSAVAIVLGLTMFAGLLVAGAAPSLGPVAPLVAGAVAAACLFAALGNPAGNESPGAMDNASGLAVLVHAARTLPRELELENLDLTFLGTGAEEIGLAGALRWIQRHGPELDPSRVAFVNLDSVGVGKGLLAIDLHDPAGLGLRAHLRAASRESDVDLRIVPFLPGVGVDTMPIAARGFATVTLLGRVLGSASRRIHTSRDTVEALREEALEDACELVRAFARSFCRGPGLPRDVS